MVIGDLFVCLIVFTIWCCVKSCLQARAREAQEAEGLDSVRQTMSERRRLEADMTSEELENYRRAIVEANLFRKKLEEGEDIKSLQNAIHAATNSYEANPEGNFFQRTWNAAADSVRSLTNSEPECSICLDQYKTGDTLCWAKSNQCNHIFHEECISEWLKDHEDCPLCRTPLLTGDHQENDDANGVDEQVPDNETNEQSPTNETEA
mmetsp:Transcript_6261/g.8852  ORF Transcript_6261/g.8852 Transcript_6261/m.8852 type:complete len:207 (+) Transcript_6261:210-830(+)